MYSAEKQEQASKLLGDISQLVSTLPSCQALSFKDRSVIKRISIEGEALLKSDARQAYSVLSAIKAIEFCFEDSLEYYRKSCRLQPDWQTDLNFSVSCQYMGRTDEAIKCASDAVNKYPELPRLHCNYASTLVEHGDFAEAKKVLEAALKFNDEKIESDLRFADVVLNQLSELEIPKEAVKDYFAVIYSFIREQKIRIPAQERSILIDGSDEWVFIQYVTQAESSQVEVLNDQLIDLLIDSEIPPQLTSLITVRFK